MKLSQLFSDQTRSENVNRPQMTPAQIESMNRQIRSLAPGQTISGEIVSRNGSEVQIRLSDDVILNARVDKDLNLEVGKNMTFEVKNNGSALTLSPLFTNVATDVNVLKALNMAGLPVNETSVGMTEQLMAAALPVNKSILQQIYREINSFPESDITDVINLHKLQMPVNEANLAQMASYRNLTHQLTQGMDAILEALPEVFDSMTAEGDIPGAMRLYRELFELAEQKENLSGAGKEADQILEGTGKGQERASGAAGENGSLGEAGDLNETAQNNVTLGSGAGEEANRAFGMGMTLAAFSGKAQEGKTQDALAGGMTQAVSEEDVSQEADAIQASENETAARTAAGRSIARAAMGLLEDLRLPSGEAQAHRELILGFARGEVDTKAFLADLELLARQSMMEPGARYAAKSFGRLFSRQSFRALLTETLKSSWMLKPQELENPGRVEELYRRMDRQLKSLSGALEEAGQNGSTAFRAASSMSQNIDFLQQVNQMYSYVQLPFRLQHGEAHGELYVYANKKKLTRSDGAVSALLHLDMEHLGAVDVYVAMQSGRVNTKFYLQDEEMIDFLSGHMELLTKRLTKRGYDCNFSMTVRGKESKNAGEPQKAGGLTPLLDQEGGIMLSQYAFDVRT